MCFRAFFITKRFLCIRLLLKCHGISLGSRYLRINNTLPLLPAHSMLTIFLAHTMVIILRLFAAHESLVHEYLLSDRTWDHVKIHSPSLVR